MDNLDLGIKFVGQSLKMRFERSRIGMAWFFIEPLVLIAILYVVFSALLRWQIDNYVPYLCIGVVVWSFFAAAVQDAGHALFAKKNLVMNATFDLRMVPLSVCIAHSIAQIISFTVMLLFMLAFHKVSFGLSWFLTPVIMGLHIVFCCGCGLLIAVLTAFMRDVLYGLPLFLMMWFYVTPIFYTQEMVPRFLTFVVRMNPMAIFIEAYRTVILGREMIGLPSWGLMIGYAVISVVIGNSFFQRNKRILVKAL